MFAIQNIRTGKFMFGTDYRYYPPRQRTSYNRMITYEDYASAKSDLLCRRCGENYCVVELERPKVKFIYHDPSHNG